MRLSEPWNGRKIIKSKNNMKDTSRTLFIILFSAIILVIAILTHQDPENYIRGWAAENKYSVTNIEKPWLNHGPFFLIAKEQTVYKVTVKDYYEKEYIVWFRLPKNWNQNSSWEWDKYKHP